MYLERRRYFLYVILAALFLSGETASAVEFQPGVGVAVEYTDNAELSPENTVNDLITVGYVGASISENEGSLIYNATTSLNKQSYTQDTFADQRYFNLAANADWEMIRDRFNWEVSDTFSQRTINTLDSNTPDNLQDTNAFTLGANIRFPLSARQNFSLNPFFSQYYYEAQAADNKQYSLSANWDYQMSRLTNVGLNLSAREIEYTESDDSGNAITDTTFINLAIIFNGRRLHSDFAINLGATDVKREGSKGDTGFTGSINLLTDLSSRSKFSTIVSSEISDTSSESQSATGDLVNVDSDDVQISSDVIRNSVFSLAYLREGASLHSRIWAEYRKLNYNEALLDREINAFGVELNYPVTQLLSSGIYVNHDRMKELDINRTDKNYTVGGNLKYSFTRKWHSLFDIKYRKQESSIEPQNYDEFSVFASLVYGFGNVQRPSRAGGF